MMETIQNESIITEINDAANNEKEKTEKSYSGRKTFAFSDESQHQMVEQILAQKPKELTNGDVLVRALKLFVEQEEMHQSLNHLPQTAADIFKGDLAKLDVAFETIRSVFSTQMKSSTDLILQREENMQRKYETLLNQKDTQLEVSNKQIELLSSENEGLKETIETFKTKETDWIQTKHTVSTLQQALQNEQQRAQGLETQLEVQGNARLKEMEETIKTLQSQVQTLEGVNRELSLKNEHLLSEKNGLQSENQAKEDRLRQLEVERQTLQEQLITTTQQSQERIERLMEELLQTKQEKK